MRLIDADALGVGRCSMEILPAAYCAGWNGLINLIESAPTIDPESLHKKGEWISVEDRLPEEKVNCIVHYKHAYCDNDDYWAIGICFYNGKKFRMDWAYKVTHWMPLPEPPAED